MLKNVSTVLIVLVGMFALAFQTTRENDRDTNDLTKATGLYEPIVVLELFTSQGCSSCPPADALLQKTKNQFEKEVFALSYHVDYWNYIGWEDPFSDAKYAKKQRRYNIKFRNRSNYTPQVVVNGKEHFVGSSAGKMLAAIDTYRGIRSANQIVAKAVHLTDGVLNFTYAIKGPRQGKRIRALLVLNERTTSVRRGENRNRTLKNSNIVVAEKTQVLDMEQGSMSLHVPEIVKPNEKVGLIVLVENEEDDITGAFKQEIDRI